MDDTEVGDTEAQSVETPGEGGMVQDDVATGMPDDDDVEEAQESAEETSENNDGSGLPF